MQDARDFLESMRTYVTPDPSTQDVKSSQKANRLGTIDSAYAGTGLPLVLFDGETLIGVKGYPWVGAKPAAGDRVVLAPVGTSYVIVGTVGGPVGVNPYAVASGVATTAGTIASDGTQAVAITFPSGRFNVAPIVFATAQSTRLLPSITASSTTGATITVRSVNGSTATGQLINWMAVQMTSSSAAG